MTSVAYSVCPHDCPSTCALEVEIVDGQRIGAVRGGQENSYTAGVICSKVARYAERVHHPDRLLHPLIRNGPKAQGQFRTASWEEALGVVVDAFRAAEDNHGSEAIWPYYYAGTMGLVMRDGINRLRHAKNYSGEHATICVTSAWTGFLAGTGKLAGVDPREMAESDVIVIWGTNAAATQVNVMNHALRARRRRGARIVVVDVYENATAKQADLFLCVKPGTDGALACAVMHILFRDGYADRSYLERYTDCPNDLENHLQDRHPHWAAARCGVTAEEIEKLAVLIGRHKRSYFRLGYGFSRQRNGPVNMHAVACIPVVTGAWLHTGGGAMMNNSAIYHWDRTLIDGLDARDHSVRALDQSRIGEILCSEPEVLHGGPPVTAMLIQNTNPVVVAPNSSKVASGFVRDDLFVCVHEQFMTETAAMADVVLPATMFLEHDDLYQSGGHQHIHFGPRLIDPPGLCRSNHELICELAQRLGAEHRGFTMSPREIIDETLRVSGWGDLASLENSHWRDCQPEFSTSHYIDGFAHADSKFHFRVDWSGYREAAIGAQNSPMPPELPDHWPVIEAATEEAPFRLVTAPARHFLNSTFNETPTSQRRERRPTVLLHPADAAELGLRNDDVVQLGNDHGHLKIHVEIFAGLSRGVLVSEGLWPNRFFIDGVGINVLTGSDPIAPAGGAAFHDVRVWLKHAGKS